MSEVPAKTECMNCNKRFTAIKQLEMGCMEQKKRIDQNISSDRQRNIHALNQMYFEKRHEIENNTSLICMRSCEWIIQGGTRQDAKDCAACTEFQQELAQKNKAIKELEEANDKTRSELEELKKKHHVFRQRMSVEASVEIGTSGELFEDISNPCRESELRSSYNKMKTTMWPKCLKEIEQKVKASREGTVDKNEEKKKVKRMIKEVFAKAANDMVEKKMALESLFKISDKTTADKKRLQCFEMAVQSLQLMIFWEECRRYKDMYKQLGHISPDYLCELADQCYKQGCLMELHNPPLTPDWDNSDSACPFPDVTAKSMHTNYIDEV